MTNKAVAIVDSQMVKPKPVKRSRRKVDGDDGYRQGALFFEYSDDEEEAVDDMFEMQTSSSFMQKMQEEMKRSITPLPIVSLCGKGDIVWTLIIVSGSFSCRSRWWWPMIEHDRLKIRRSQWEIKTWHIV